MSTVQSVLRAPRVPTLLAASQVGRLPLAAGPLALLLFARESVSLALAGLVVAVYTAGMAVSAPMLARSVDRWRQPPVLFASSALSAAGFVAVASGGGDLVVTLVGAAFAGLGTPPLEACLRALWPALVPPPAVAAAYTVDIALQEVIFVAGPLVTLAAVGVAGPPAGLFAAAACQLAGAIVFALSPPVRAWRGEPAPRHWAGPLRVPRFVVLVAGVVCTGAAVGSLPVVITGYAEAAGDRALSGWLLAAQAGGALVGGLLYTRAKQGGPGRLPVLAACFAVGYLPLLLMPGLGAMAVLVALSGVALPPLLTAVFLTTDRLAPPGTVVEAFAWIVTAFTVGSATGAALTGPLAATDLRAGFALAPVAGLLAVVAMAAVHPWRRARQDDARALDDQVVQTGDR
ncbi:MFS transporter [Asanoa sp. WMMD1127]|uniref:MFS transporter n=1 Tax=Asanoa sp. WMMD1127 TaxID=3016107 RepID=UPI00241602F5|nr:MFS transporter [Asanoa sp. WMMD1127]MDG4821755.1 MFS transporter [Asanoa sp. WMMD1127]